MRTDARTSDAKSGNYLTGTHDDMDRPPPAAADAPAADRLLGPDHFPDEGDRQSTLCL